LMGLLYMPSAMTSRDIFLPKKLLGVLSDVVEHTSVELGELLEHLGLDPGSEADCS